MNPLWSLKYLQTSHLQFTTIENSTFVQKQTDIRENVWKNACPQGGTCYGQMLNVRGQKEASFSESYSLKTKKKAKPI